MRLIQVKHHPQFSFHPLVYFAYTDLSTNVHWIMVQENQHKLTQITGFIYNILIWFPFWFDESYLSLARYFCRIYCRLLLLLVFKHFKKIQKSIKKWSKQISTLLVLLYAHSRIFTRFCEFIHVEVPIKILAESSLWWLALYSSFFHEQNFSCF